MPAPTLNVASTYYPLPATARYATMKDESAALALTGALSFSLIHETCYRQVNYRDETPAAFAGGPASAVGSQITQLADVPTAGVTTPVSSSAEISLTSNGSIIQASDSFMKVAPKNESFKRTMMVFWSAADGTGNVIAYLDFAKFDQFSPAVPAPY